MRFALPIVVLALAACSQPSEEQESADDFASRIGQQGGAGLDQSQPDPDGPNVAVSAPPVNVDLTSLQQLGDIGGVNLGPRHGGCTFMAGEQEMLVASGMNEATVPGKAVVRIADTLVVADSGPGGLAAIKSGTTFTGEGFKVEISARVGASQSRPATITVTDAAGKSQSYSGNWICA
ncbi:MAG: hypothetical protein R3E14_13730 [Erythrobacter sp.]